MKIVTHISIKFLMLIMMLSFYQCATTPKFEDKLPTEIQDTYYQKWVAGVQGGGSGINLYIKANDTSVVLDSVYFRGKVAKLETRVNNRSLYIARFVNKSKKNTDITISSNPKEEVDNTIELNTPKIPFELKPNECVVAYQFQGKTLFHKISNLKEKPALQYPSSPSKAN